MKHIKSFDQVNEGVLDTIKELIFPSIYRISFKVTHRRGEGKVQKRDGDVTKSDKVKDETFKPQHKILDVKAKNQDLAEDKFETLVARALSGIDQRPEVEITSIHKVKKAEYKNLKLF